MSSRFDDAITAADLNQRTAMEKASAIFVERLSAEREGRVAYTAQLVLL